MVMPRQAKIWTVVAGLATGWFTYQVLLNAWVAEDAFITLRVVDNFWQGYGLRWNVFERVQVFTHPLWLIWQVLTWKLAADPVVGLWLWGTVFSALAIAWLWWKLPGTLAGKLLASAILMSSLSVLSYTTSGLETSLTSLLLVVWAWAYWRDKPVWLALVSAGLWLNRLDLILLILPGLVWYTGHKLTDSRWRLGFWLLVGLPVVSWLGFSLVYYGWAVPNTFFAKATPGLPRSWLFVQGWRYLLISWRFDPVWLVAVGLAGWTAVKQRGRVWPVAGGMALYLIYVIWNGGGFMVGRWLVPVIWLAVTVISQVNWQKHWYWLVILLWLAGRWADGHRAELFAIKADGYPFVAGVADEQALTRPYTGLGQWGRGENLSHMPWYRQAVSARSSSQPVMAVINIGITGYYAGPQVKIIDQLGLADGLLSHLPADSQNWRIGHFFRHLPAGYPETVLTGENQLVNPCLHQYYDQLIWLQQSTDYWSARRWQEIFKFNTGLNDRQLKTCLQAYPEW